MEKIAVISDIHGNVTALEAVLEDIDSRGVSAIFCLGDLIGKGPDGRRVIDRVREKCETVILGNWDDFIQKPTDSDFLSWFRDQIGGERLEYLSTLAFYRDFYMSGRRVRLFHASAESVHHRVIPWVHGEEEVAAMFQPSEWITEGEADVVGYGDIHAALVQPVDPQKILFNTGSVGNPLDLTDAAYTILHGNFESQEPGPFSIEQIRVPYDVEAEIEKARRMGMPGLDAYSDELRYAKYRGAPK